MTSSGLGIIISAALLLGLLSILQYYYTRYLMHEQIEKRAEIELLIKAVIINNTLTSAENTMQEHLWDIKNNLSNPDSMFAVTKRLIASNDNLVGGCIAFVDNYYPQKGRLFEPYAYKQDGQLMVSQIGSADHDYTQNPAFIKARDEKCQLWSDPYEYGDTARLTTYSYPLLDDKGEVVAVCGLDIDLSWLTDTLNGRHMFPSSFGLMLTAGGKLVAGAPDKHAKKESIEQIVSLINDSTVQRKTRESGRVTYIEFTDQNDGSKGSVCYRSLRKDPHWLVALVNYDNEVYEPLHKMRSRNRLLSLLGLLVLFFIVSRYRQGERRLQQTNLRQERINSELHIASSLQQAMLPKTFPPYPDRNDIDLYASLVPAKEVGGDMFDHFIRDEKLFFCIGDVSGKGVPSAIVMAVMNSLFRQISAHYSNPANIVHEMNQELCRNNESNMFMTFFVGVLDLPTGRLRYCNAGHDNPIVLTDKMEKLPMKAHLPLGVFRDTEFEKEETLLTPGTMLFLYTDGLTEARNPEGKQYRKSRVWEVLEQCLRQPSLTAQEVLTTMSDNVQQFMGDAALSDDLTMLAFRYLRAKEEDTLCESLTLQNDIAQVGTLNDFVKRISTAHGLEKRTMRQLQLAVEEVVVNIMNYAYPSGITGDIRIDAHGNNRRMKFVISDEGMPFDPTEVADADTTLKAEDRPIGGLGITLTRKLVDSVNYERIDNRNILTLRKRIDREKSEQT